MVLKMQRSLQYKLEQQYRKDMAEKVLADNAELQGAIHI